MMVHLMMVASPQTHARKINLPYMYVRHQKSSTTINFAAFELLSTSFSRIHVHVSAIREIIYKRTCHIGVSSQLLVSLSPSLNNNTVAVPYISMGERSRRFKHDTLGCRTSAVSKRTFRQRTTRPQTFWQKILSQGQKRKSNGLNTYVRTYRAHSSIRANSIQQQTRDTCQSATHTVYDTRQARTCALCSDNSQ